VAATGTYATVVKAVDTLFQGNVFANGGTPRALTLDLMRQARRGVRTNGGAVDLWVCDLTTFDRYGGLIDPQRRYVDTIRTAKGEVKLDAGYKALEFEGAAFIGDKDAPAGTLIGMTTSWVEWRILPKDQDLAASCRRWSPASTRRTPRSSRPDSPSPSCPSPAPATRRTSSAVCYPQLVVRRPNQQLIISDIA
jgi:hypothetical protein